MILVAPDHIEGRSGRLLKKETAHDQRAISGKYSFAKGDIVYSKIRPNLRKATLVDFDGLCSADMYPFKPAEDVSAGFILATILGYQFSNYAESVSARSGMPKINRAELAAFTVALPPTKLEQQAIAEALSDADTLIEGLEALIAKKRQLKQGTMQELITGSKRLSGFTEDWSEIRLGELFDFKNGLNKAKAFFGYGVPIVNYMDVYNSSKIYYSNLKGRVSLTAQEIKNFEVRRGDVFFTRTSETPDEIGVASVVLDEAKQTVFSGCVLRGRPKDGRICNEFKAYCFQSEYVRKQIVSQASYTTRALTNGKLLSKVLLPLPHLKEQTAIATVLSDMDAEIAVLEGKLAKARRVKAGMMQDLLTGRVRLV